MLMEQAVLTRRKLLGAGVAAGGGGWLAGCAAPEAAPVAGDREVDTDHGPVRVPIRPERVVCGDFYGAFAVADLDLVPVGAGGAGYAGTGPGYAEKLAGVPSTGDFTEPDLEQVAAQRPDLILRTIDTDDDLYQRLTAIAPTVVISFQQLSLVDVANRIGSVLGRVAESDQLTAQYRDATAAIRHDHAGLLQANRASYVAMATENTFWTHGPAWTDTSVLVDCGVRLAEPSASQTGPTAEHSLEKLDVLAESTYLFINAGPDGRTAAEDTEPLTGTRLWSTLPAVQAGRVYPIPYGAASLGTALELTVRLREILGGW